MKFCGEVARRPGMKWLDFGGDADSFVDSGASTILYR